MMARLTWWTILGTLLGWAVHPAPASGRRAKIGSLVVESMTDGITIYIDGEKVGRTPLPNPIQLRPGRHQLKAVKAGYGLLKLPFTIRAGKTTELPVELLPYSGLVRFSSNIEEADVYLDNKMVGSIGSSPLVLSVVVGDHRILIVKDGYNDYETKVNVKAGEKHFVEANLSPFDGISPEVREMARAHEEKKKAETQARLATLEASRADVAVPAPPPWYAGLHKKWWVWTIAGVVVLTAVTVPLAVAGGGEEGGSGRHQDSAHSILDLRP